MGDVTSMQGMKRIPMGTPSGACVFCGKHKLKRDKFSEKELALFDTARSAFNSLGINIAYYKELIPEDIRMQIQAELEKKDIWCEIL